MNQLYYGQQTGLIADYPAECGILIIGMAFADGHIMPCFLNVALRSSRINLHLLVLLFSLWFFVPVATATLSRTKQLSYGILQMFRPTLDVPCLEAW